MRHYRAYTDEDVINSAVKVYSIAGLLNELGLKPAGGNYQSMYRLINQMGIDTSHWTGQAWNRNRHFKTVSGYSSKGSRKKRLIDYRGHQCEICKLTMWLGKPINLEVHHIDGDNSNNSDDNLQLLCPNCHSCTPNFRGKNRVSQFKKDRPRCIDCEVEISPKGTRCRRCAAQHRHGDVIVKIAKDRPTKIAWPSNDELKQMLADSSYLAVGRKLGVSDNAVRKRLYASTEISAGLITKAV